ncbi:MAG: DNA topoisomerase III, partial [Smithella sp.]|nr:DNA topoisomerase III [Smithella sp.]
MRLVIAEKPSVAQSIAAVLGAKERKDGYLQGGGFLVSWCVGHLVELAPADVYDEKYAKWRREDLPILPDRWQYVVPKGKEKQLKVLRGLMARKDVEGIVCATDAGREGELIFRLVYTHCDCKKPVQRLWISSMEASAIS